MWDRWHGLSFGSTGIFAFLNEDIDDITILVDGAPQIAALALNRHGDFIEKPAITARPAGLANHSCIVRPEGCTPLPDSFVGDSDSAFSKQIFYFAKTECEPVVEPHGVRDDVWWETISTVA